MWKIVVKRSVVLTIILSACASCTGEGTENINDKDTVDSTDGFQMYCDGGSIEKSSIDADLDETSEQFNGLETLRLVSCVPPIGSYAVALQAVNIDVTALKSLSLVETPPGRALRDDQFVGLTLQELQIETEHISYVIHGPFSKNGHVDLTTGEDITLECFENTLEDMSPIPTADPVRFNHITISMCPPPRDSYASVLRTLNVDAAISNLTILYFPTTSPPLLARHFFNLSIIELTIQNHEVIDNTHDILSNTHKMVVDGDFLEPLVKTLEVLTVRNVRLPQLPESNRIVKAVLSDGFSTTQWGGCSELQKLEISRWVQAPEGTSEQGWLSHCPKLRDLSLCRLPEYNVRRALTGARHLTALSVTYCDITQLSETLLKDVVQLRELNLSNNKLLIVESESFKSLTLLETLDLSGNDLWDSEQAALALGSVPALRTLILDDNPKLDICGNNVGTDTRPHLKKLSLKRTKVDYLCFGSFDSLAFLDLSGNKNISVLKLQELPSPQTHPLVVDFSDSNFGYLPSTSEDYVDIITKFKQVMNVTILLDLSVDCDCQYGWISRALRSLPHLSMVGARCSNGEHLYGSSPELINTLECNKSYYEGCTLRRAWEGNATTADCRSVKPRLDILFGLNYTGEESKKGVPGDLLSIDLRDNGISRANPAVTEAMFGVKERQVQLAGNPLVCDCDNQLLLSALHTHRSQVDFDNISCVDDGRPLSNVELDELCTTNLWSQAPLAAYLALGCVVLTVAAAVYYRYGRSIKVFLYSHGYCLSCLHEEEIDADRTYDAFISFCHTDFEFVDDHLLPGLSGYKLCIHYRDWIAGEYIPAQIARSIEQSKRTVILLSRSFLDSIWGLLEFRMAYASTLEEGRARIIVVLLDDVLDDERLDAELRSYLATNTYVRWGDPWFWRKLRYALPHRRKQGSEDCIIELEPQISIADTNEETVSSQVTNPND